jgi:hypothetical protein
MFVLDLLARWTHVGAAIVLMGGAIFTRFVLMPAAAELPEEQHLALKERLRVRWSKIVMWGIMALLVSGFYNFFSGMQQHKGQQPPLYHILAGTKMLLGFGAFFLASVLSGRSAKFAPLRADARKWLGVLIAITAIVSGIGGYLKVGVVANPVSTQAK